MVSESLTALEMPVCNQQNLVYHTGTIQFLTTAETFESNWTITGQKHELWIVYPQFGMHVKQLILKLKKKKQNFFTQKC